MNGTKTESVMKLFDLLECGLSGIISKLLDSLLEGVGLNQID